MLSKSILVLAVLLTGALLPQVAWAGCFYETSLNSQQVTFTPAAECLDVELVGDDCGQAVEVLLTNNCDQTVTGTSEVGWTCGEATCSENSAGTGVEVAPGETARVYEADFEEGEDVTRHYPVMLGEDEIDVAVTFNARIDETDGSGCSHTPARPTAPWMLAALTFVGAALLRRRGEAGAIG